MQPVISQLLIDGDAHVVREMQAGQPELRLAPVGVDRIGGEGDEQKLVDRLRGGLGRLRDQPEVIAGRGPASEGGKVFHSGGGLAWKGNHGIDRHPLQGFQAGMEGEG